MSVRGRLELVYPALLAAYPVISLAAGNPGEFLWAHLAALVLLLLLCGAVVHWLVALVLRGASRSRVAVTAAAANAWLFCAPSVADRLPALLPRYTLPALLLVCVGVAAWARRSEHGAAALSRAAAVFTVALTGAGVVTLLVTDLRGRAAYAASPVVGAIRGGLPAPSALARRPDVYVVILDNFSNAAVMRDFYGVDTRSFQDSLRALGFVIPAATHSNYCFTAPSVASFLNGVHVRGLAEDVGPDSHNREPLYKLSIDNAVSRWFRAAGYAVYVQPSVGFPGTARNVSSTGTFGPGGIERARLAIASVTLLPFVWHRTIPGRAYDRIYGEWGYGRERLIALRSLASTAGLPGPKLVIAHSLAAHLPYVYDPTCRIVAAPSDSADVSPAYPPTVACTERLVLAAVRRILRESTLPPVVVLQADHGTRRSLPPQGDSAAFITADQARECTGAFGAYLIPGVALPDTVSNVNVMRYVLRSLGATLPMVSDAAFFNTADFPYRFVDVTPFLSAPTGREQVAGAPPP